MYQMYTRSVGPPQRLISDTRLCSLDDILNEWAVNAKILTFKPLLTSSCFLRLFVSPLRRFFLVRLFAPSGDASDAYITIELLDGVEEGFICRRKQYM